MRSRHFARHIPVATRIAPRPQHEEGSTKIEGMAVEKWAEVSREMTTRWRGVWIFVCQLWNALIGNYSPVSRLLSSSNYLPSALAVGLVFYWSTVCPAAFFLLFGLDSVADHISRSITTTPCQYSGSWIVKSSSMMKVTTSVPPALRSGGTK